MTEAERRVLSRLADGGWHREDTLRTSFRLLQELYLRGVVDGAMMSTGNSAADRVWRLACMDHA